jgi:hypothetical protein
LVGGGDIYDGQLFVPAVENRPRWRLIFSPPSGRLLLSITVKKSYMVFIYNSRDNTVPVRLAWTSLLQLGIGEWPDPTWRHSAQIH